VPTDPGSPGIVDLVLGGPGPRPRWHLPVAIVVALATHAGLWPLARQAGVQKRAPGSVPRDRIPIEIALDQPIPPPPPPAPPLVEPPARRPAVQRAPGPADPLPPPPAPPPAQAGALLAEEPDPAAPLDLTAQSFVVGTASRYAGGLTAPDGTAEAAAHARKVDPSSSTGVGDHAGDLSSAVSLEQHSWSCPWPPEAETERIDEQTVVIRVVVDAEGTAVSVEVISDPGHGFGPAAATCARQTRFTAAHDPSGAPIPARSPPIRVRFTR
jgi:protein TonB